MRDKKSRLSGLNIPLDRDIFLRSLIRELAGTLEDVVGYREAAGYISLVGQNVGEWINMMYKNALGAPHLTRDQVVDVLIDLKDRIQGDFSITEQNDQKVILTNLVCPFEEKVVDRPSMCMMTSNVFGIIVAENLGYAKVVLEQTIAKQADCCRVVVYMKCTPEAEAAEGREYYGTTDANAGQNIS